MRRKRNAGRPRGVVGRNFGVTQGQQAVTHLIGLARRDYMKNPDCLACKQPGSPAELPRRMINAPERESKEKTPTAFGRATMGTVGVS